MTEDPSGELLVYVGLGQSLLAKTPHLRPLGEKTGLLDQDRALVFGVGGDSRFGSNVMQDLPAEALAAVYPHVRTARAVPLAAASAEILASLRPQDSLLTVNLARKGAGLAHFGREADTASFRNLRRCLERSIEVAQERNLHVRRLVISWVQGQADDRTPARSYTAHLLQLVDDVEALFAELTAGRGKVLVCLSQVTAKAPAGRRGAPLAQFDAVAARPGSMILAGPEYMLERSDGVHLKPISAAYLGKLHGRAIANALQGGRWQPLHMAAATVLGDVVTVRFSGGVGALETAAQTTAEGPVHIGVRKLPHLGFRWFEAGNPEAAILRAEVSGPCEVRIQLSAPPPVEAKCALSLGFPLEVGRPEGFSRGDPDLARGGGTNLRTMGDGADCLGIPIQDWAIQQVITVSRMSGD